MPQFFFFHIHKFKFKAIPYSVLLVTLITEHHVCVTWEGKHNWMQSMCNTESGQELPDETPCALLDRMDPTHQRQSCWHFLTERQKIMNKKVKWWLFESVYLQLFLRNAHSNKNIFLMKDMHNVILVLGPYFFINGKCGDKSREWLSAFFLIYETRTL